MSSWQGRSSGPPPVGTRRFSALRTRNFSLLWFGLIVSNAGSWMQLVAQGWLVYDLTHSPFVLGLVGLSRAIPMIVLPPFGGAVADRVPRMQLLKITQLASFLLAVPLGFLVMTHSVQVWQIVLLGALSGAVSAFDQPTRQALLPDLVREQDLTSAIALNSAAWQGASLIGPALAGVTIAVLGIASAFFLNALSFLVVVAALYAMRNVPERSGDRQPRGFMDDVGAGLHYAATTPFVLTLLLLSAVTNIFGRSYLQLLPAFAQDMLGQGSAGLGFMNAAPGLGTLAAAFTIAAFGDIRRKGSMLLVSMGLFSVIVSLFATTHSFSLALVLLTLAGITSFVFSTMMMTMLQLHVPPMMRGRVLALVTVTAQGLAPLGALLVGAGAEWSGTSNAVAASAILVGAAALATAMFVPSLRASGLGPDDASPHPVVPGHAPGRPNP